MRWEQLLVLLVFLVWPILQELAKKRARQKADREAPLEEDEFGEQALPEWFPQQHAPEKHIPRQHIPDQHLPQPHTPRQHIPKQYTPVSLERQVYTAPHKPPPAVPSGPPVLARKDAATALVRVPAKSPLPSPRTIRATLRSSEGFRQAMVHKIVLGQPRAMRPHE